MFIGNDNTFSETVEKSLADIAANDDELPDIRPRSPAEALEPGRAPKPPAEKRKRRMHPLFSFLNALMTLLIIVPLGLGGIFYFAKAQYYDKPGPLDHSTVLVIPQGEGLNAIATRLEREKIINDKWLFVASAYYFDAQNKLKYGEYQIAKNASMRQVLDTLVEGRAILYKVTIPEGLTSWQVVERLNAHEVLKGEISNIPPEGSLLPETFKFGRSSTRQEIIERMQAEQRKFIAKVWESREPDLPFETPEEAITLASIVEKETGQADERDRVAAVFINRIRKRMRLQSDPTIIYGVSEGRGTLGRPILRSELEQANPYNTYQVAGLPPTPIANPGRASIEAVLRPAKIDALYFVADGTGGHVFARTLNEHNRNVAKWRVIEAQIRARQAEEARMAALKGSDEGKDAPAAAPAMVFPGMDASGLPLLPPGTDLSSFGLPSNTPLLSSETTAQASTNALPEASSGELGVPLPLRNPRLR